MVSPGKSAREKAILELIGQYFDKMRETSALVDPIIISSFKSSKGRICRDDEVCNRLHEAAMERIGKSKMRSHIARMGYEICGGKNLVGFLPVAAAMDLLEFSYYCCDAIFDKNIYGNRRLVEDKIVVSHMLSSIALGLVGDSLTKLELETAQASGILATMSRFVRDIHEGFYIENHNNGPSRELYELRTYAYNYWEHILKMAAIATGAGHSEIDALSNFGKNVGIAYMVANDIADIIKGHEDIKNGRYTLPNIVFLEKANEDEKRKFMEVFGDKNAGTEKLFEVAQLMVDKNVVDDCQLYASKFVEEALTQLRPFDDSRWKRMLAVSTMAVYKNQWYRAITKTHGYRRTIRLPDLGLAGITCV